ncbi:MAG: racemase [Armatimonadetes bacterium]|nr:racemase [Armatimonadota bacterium]MDW8123059.1 enolase C-terminal domain-like protein [Armatimonadota bacterium]
MATMRITDVRAYVIEVETKRFFRWRHGLPGSEAKAEVCWLHILTDEGVDGLAASGHGFIVADTVRRRLKEALIGKNPLQKEEIWHLLWEIDRIEEFPIYAFGLTDIALWDITAKVAGLPLYQILGGAREKILAYASTVTWETEEDYLRYADQLVAMGYKAIKLHAWGDVKRDGQLALRLRRHLGDDIFLMYDGSAGFRYEEALALGKMLEEANFLWYEEPMREFNIWQYARLCRDLTIPILVPETTEGSHYNAADFIVHGAADLIRTSTHFKGGITGALRIAHLADSFGMYVEVHGGGYPNLHIALAVPNTRFYEILVIDDPEREREEQGELGIDRDGYVHAPTRPGIGWQVDLEEIQKRSIAIV